ncbi:transcriptional regulator [soil metagenome]|nr:helix-turn-helix domain-containing protein [Deinococcota bacterium]
MALKTDRARAAGAKRGGGGRRGQAAGARAVQYRGTKSSLLRLIKERGGATTSQLAQALGLTRACVHSHVTDLVGAGLVSLRETLKEGRGRPGHLYELTLDGENHFPKSYARLAGDVLTQLERSSGAAAVAGVLEARNSPFGLLWRQASEGRSLSDRLAYLAERLSEQGYEARIVSQDGDYLLLLGNCPFPAVAREHPALCEAEGKLHQQVLGVPVRRESRIVDGARCCTYRLLLG